MNICLISEEFPPETGWGGIGTHTYNISLALADMGNDVYVLSKSVDAMLHISRKGRLAIYRVPDHGRSAGNGFSGAALSALGRLPLSGLNEYPLRSLRRGAALVRCMHQLPSFDIIEAPDYGGETFWHQFFSAQKTPIVIKLHTPLYLTQRLNDAPRDVLAVKVRKWIERYCMKHATKLISPTKSLADIISNELRIDEIEVLPNCVDTDFFINRAKNGNRVQKTVLYAGRLERRKGVEVLAKAIPSIVAKAPQIKFQFVGRDTPTAGGGVSMKSWLETFFQQQNVSRHVEFVGEVPRTGIVTYFQEADLCVLPSLWENLPYTCLEAMACGTPVVASNIGGFPEIITDGVDGLLFETRNSEELARKVTAMIKDHDLELLGKRARQKIENTFSHRVIAEKTVDFYQKVCRNSSYA
jgi:glycosyltransferase involved in cell wall biosynthesis